MRISAAVEDAGVLDDDGARLGWKFFATCAERARRPCGVTEAARGAPVTCGPVMLLLSSHFITIHWSTYGAGRPSVVGTEAVAARGAGVEDRGTFVRGPQLQRVVAHLVVPALGTLFLDGGTFVELVLGQRRFDDGAFGAQRGREGVVGRRGDDLEVRELGLGVRRVALRAHDVRGLDGGRVVQQVAALYAKDQRPYHGHEMGWDGAMGRWDGSDEN